jgi:hypothetical protein
MVAQKRKPRELYGLARHFPIVDHFSKEEITLFYQLN